MRSLKPEQLGSPLVQEKYQEEKACDKRHTYKNNNNNNNVGLWSIFITLTTFQNAEISIKRHKGKAVPVHAIQTYGGSGGTVLFVIKLGTSLGSGVSLSPRTLELGEKHPIPTDYEIGWASDPFPTRQYTLHLP